MILSLALHRDTYVDSVVQLSGTRAMRAVDGVDWASAAMATPGNLDTLAAEGFDPPDAGVNDLVVAVRAASEEAVAGARVAADAAMFAARSGAAPTPPPPPAAPPPPSPRRARSVRRSRGRPERTSR